MSDNSDYVTCPPCVAAWGEETAALCGCGTHTAVVQALAKLLAGTVHETDEPTLEQIGWFIDDADVVAEGWPDDTPLEVVDLGRQPDDRRHWTINGDRWAEPDPNAEGFNAIVEMAECPHPLLPSEGDDDWDDEVTPEDCEECRGTGWAEAALIAHLTQKGSSPS